MSRYELAATGRRYPKRLNKGDRVTVAIDGACLEATVSGTIIVPSVSSGTFRLNGDDMRFEQRWRGVRRRFNAC